MIPSLRYLLLIGWLLVVLLISACGNTDQEIESIKFYSGPVLATRQLDLIYSDSARIKLRIKAPERLEFLNGDQEFPQGITVYFYNGADTASSYLKSKYAQYNKQNDIFVATKDVVVENKLEGKKLNTEELRWSRSRQKIYTDKYVIVTTAKEKLTGTGLEAAQDFSYYTILKPSGIISLEGQQDGLF